MKINPAILDFNKCDIETYAEFLIPNYSRDYGVEFPNQIKYLYQYFKEFNCTHVYREELYYSNSFIYDYASFHVYRSSAANKYCSRFIYLSLGASEINGIQDFKNKYIFGGKLSNKNLLGVNIIKPTYALNHKFGLSYLKPYDTEVEPNLTRYFNSLIERKVNVLGVELTLRSSVLNGQDELGLCSTSALYSITNWLSKTLDTKNFHPGELTKYIGKNFSNNGFRTLPSTGLSTGQIMVFLQHLKLTFDKFEVKKITHTEINVNDFLIGIADNILFIKEIIRAYNFACGFPVLLGLNRKFMTSNKLGGLHNSVCVGFREDQSKYHNGSLAQNIDRLYVCDDNIGSQTSVNFLDPVRFNQETLNEINKYIDFNHVSAESKSYLNVEQNFEAKEKEFTLKNALNIFENEMLNEKEFSESFNPYHLFSTVDEEVVCIDSIDYLLIPIPRTITVTLITIKEFFFRINQRYSTDTVLYKSNDLKNYYLNLDDKVFEPKHKSRFIELLLHKYVWRVSIMEIVHSGQKIRSIADFIFDSNEQKESPNFLSSSIIFNKDKFEELLKYDNSGLQNLVKNNTGKLIYALK